MAVDAKRCPRCQSWQARWAGFWFGNSSPTSGGQMIFLTVAMVALMWAGTRFFFFPSSADFQDRRGDLSFASQTLTFAKEKDREYFAVVGTIRNSSKITWRDLHVEARFLNS